MKFDKDSHFFSDVSIAYLFVHVKIVKIYKYLSSFNSRKTKTN